MDFSNFKLRINIQAPAQLIYRSLATPAGLEQWFLREAIFYSSEHLKREAEELIQVDDTYSMRWHGYSDEITHTGKVLCGDGLQQFGFTFSLGCPVIFNIYPDQKTQILELICRDLPVLNGMPHEHFIIDPRGWTFYLTNLKSVLEGGLDLRNRDASLTQVITA